MQSAVLVLMNDSSPIAQLQIGFPKTAQIGYQNAVSLHLFKGLHEFLAHLVVIKLVHAEHDATVACKRGGKFFPVHQPIRASHAFLYEIGILAEDAFAHQQMPFRKSARGDTRFQFPNCFIGKRAQRFHPIQNDFHKHQPYYR